MLWSCELIVHKSQQELLHIEKLLVFSAACIYSNNLPSACEYHFVQFEKTKWNSSQYSAQNQWKSNGAAKTKKNKETMEICVPHLKLCVLVFIKFGKETKGRACCFNSMSMFCQNMSLPTELKVYYLHWYPHAIEICPSLERFAAFIQGWKTCFVAHTTILITFDWLFLSKSEWN